MTIHASELALTFDDLDPGSAYNFRVVGVVDVNGETTVRSPAGVAEGRTSK